MSQALVTLALVVLNNMARPMRFDALWVSENTKVNVWLPPLLPLGDTESAEGCGGGMTTVQAPRDTHPLLAPASAAYRYTVLPPPKPDWNVSDTLTARVLPDSPTELPAPFAMHWLFCWLPPPKVTVCDPLTGSSLARLNTFARRS